MLQPGRLMVLALALLAIWSVWWLRRLQTTPARGPAATAHRIDYTMESFAVTAMDADGKPLYRMFADGMTHYADDDSSEFSHPHVEYIVKNSTQMHLSGEQGWMAAQGSEIHLLGAVRMDGYAKQPFTLLTRDVIFKPDDSLVETAAAAVLTSGGMHVSAIGVRVHINQKSVQLLAKVQGRYDAPSH